MKRTFITLVAYLVASPLLAQNAPEVDNAELMTRYGVLDYGTKVRKLWECLEHTRWRAKVTSTNKTAEGRYVVRVQTGQGKWMDFYFQLIDHEGALLLGFHASDGGSIEGHDGMRFLVMTINHACQN